MGARLSDRKKKKIILDRVEGLSIRAIAAKHKVSVYAVQKAIASDPDFKQKITEKNARNAQDMIDYLDSQRGRAQEIIGKLLTAMWTNDYSVTEVALMCGYDDPLYFSRVFKKHFGCSPSNFVRQDAAIHDSDPGRKEQ